MKTLIINGSPRKSGHTAYLLNELKSRLLGEWAEIMVYDGRVGPCIDCRACWVNRGCVIRDHMDIIYSDDFDNVVIASPIYMSGFTGPLVSLASRFQAYYAAQRFLKDPIPARPKKAGLILTGGGDGGPEPAINIARWMFKKMNAEYLPEHNIFSLKTDEIPACKDNEAIKGTKNLAEYFNMKMAL